MKTVYFVRHGETEANAADLYQDSETVLSSRGIEQANFVAARFADLDPEALIVSPFLRTRQTATPIAEQTGLEITLFNDLHELLPPSSLRGLSKAAPEAAGYRAFMASTFYKDPDATFEDLESFASIVKRAESVLQMLEQKSEQKIIAVTHGRFLSALIAHLVTRRINDPIVTGATNGSFVKMDNSAITVCTHSEAGWQLQMFNDCAHFAE